VGGPGTPHVRDHLPTSAAARAPYTPLRALRLVGGLGHFCGVCLPSNRRSAARACLGGLSWRLGVIGGSGVASPDMGKVVAPITMRSKWYSRLTAMGRIFPRRQQGLRPVALTGMP
jgi:hypothetical protein